MTRPAPPATPTCPCVASWRSIDLGESIMADIASELASKCGISVEAAQKGLGVVLGLLKSKLPAETFAKLSAAVPEASNMMAGADEACDQDSGGVMGAVKGAV